MAITIDGTTGIDGTGTNGELLKIKGAGSEAHLYIDNNEFSVRVDPDNDESSSILTLDIDGSEKIRVDENGRVGLGTTSVAKNDHSVLNVHSGTAGVYQYFTDSATGTGGDDGLTLGLDTSQNGMIWHRENKDIRIGTNANERLRVLAGGGLTFNGDTAAANALDDYEEGSFTPSWSNATTTTASSIWRYVKIGNLVTVWGRFQCDTTTNNAAHDVFFNNLPFTSASALTNNISEYSTSVMTFQVNTDGHTITTYMGAGSTNLEFFQTSDSANWDTLRTSDIANGSRMIVTQTYMTA